MEKIILEDIKKEKFVIDSAYNTFKKDFSKPSEKKQESVITEGLKYFKVSPRLYKLALKIERRSKRNKELKLEEVVKKITALANKFEYVEDLYAVGKKAEAKAHYKELVVKYSNILKMLKKETVKDSLKKIGGLAFTVASMVVPYMAMSYYFPNLNFQAANQEATIMKQAGVYLKRAGAFTLCGLPVKAAKGLFGSISDNVESKSLARIDKLIDNSDVDYSDYDDDELHQISV